MPAWLSPFPLPQAIVQRLQHCGWHSWPGDPKAFPADAAWLYDTPDRLLADACLVPEQLAEGYASLLAEPSGARFIALWRLLGESENAVLPPDPEPLPAALTQLLLQQHPALLDGYLDLELRADLQGGEPDLAYRRRLQQTASPAGAVAAWHALTAAAQRQEEIDALQAELSAAHGAAQEAREEAELTLLQLHQVQEELEQIFLADREKQGRLAELEALPMQLEQGRAELAAAKQDAEATLSALQEELSAAHGAAQEAREEAELTLLQLHQVQEELEHYFLLSRGQSEQLGRYSELQRRSRALLARFASRSGMVVA